MKTKEELEATGQEVMDYCNDLVHWIAGRSQSDPKIIVVALTRVFYEAAVLSGLDPLELVIGYEKVFLQDIKREHEKKKPIPPTNGSPPPTGTVN